MNKDIYMLIYFLILIIIGLSILLIYMKIDYTKIEKSIDNTSKEISDIVRKQESLIEEQKETAIKLNNQLISLQERLQQLLQ